MLEGVRRGCWRCEEGVLGGVCEEGVLGGEEGALGGMRRGCWRCEECVLEATVCPGTLAQCGCSSQMLLGWPWRVAPHIQCLMGRR